MSVFKPFQRTVLNTTVFGIIATGSLAISAPAEAVSIRFGNGTSTNIGSTTWTMVDSFGDVQINSPTSASMTNSSGVTDDATNRQLTGNFPLTTFSTPFLYTELGFANSADLNALFNVGPLSASAGLGVVEGSAIRATVANASKDDAFSFDWSFAFQDARDIGFVLITEQGTSNQMLQRLTGSDPFSYSFGAGGDYDIAIGVVDVDGFGTSSQLDVSDVMYTAASSTSPTDIPTPALLPGLIAFWGSAIRKRRQTAVV